MLFPSVLFVVAFSARSVRVCNISDRMFFFSWHYVFAHDPIWPSRRMNGSHKLSSVCVCVCVCGNLLCCGRTCRLLLAHDVSRAASRNFLFWSLFVFAARKMLTLSSDPVRITIMLLDIAQSFVGSPWCQKCVHVGKHHKNGLVRPSCGTVFFIFL